MTTGGRLHSPPPALDRAMLRYARLLAAAHGHNLGPARRSPARAGREPDPRVWWLRCRVCKRDFLVRHQVQATCPMAMSPQALSTCAGHGPEVEKTDAKQPSTAPYPQAP